MWDAVHVTGRNLRESVHADGVDAESLNKHYVSDQK